MKKVFKSRVFLICMLVLGLVGIGFAFGPEGTNGTIINPYDVFDETHRIRHVSEGSVSDSILVHNNATKYSRRIAPINTLISTFMSTGTYNVPLQNVSNRFIVNATSVGLSKATLNSNYPNAPIGYQVMCPNILLGGAIYVKAIENGSNDTWQTVSAPPTL